jgi:hypothetical protein
MIRTRMRRISWCVREGGVAIAAFIVGLVMWPAASRVRLGPVTVGFLFVLDQEKQEVVVTALRDALELIEEKDARAFSRLCRIVRRIAILPNSQPRYWHLFRVCVLGQVDIDKLHASQLASIIVHETTHAWIRHLKIGPDASSDKRKQAERMCIRAQLRFARRLGPNAGPMIHWFERQLHDYR